METSFPDLLFRLGEKRCHYRGWVSDNIPIYPVLEFLTLHGISCNGGGRIKMSTRLTSGFLIQ